MTTTQTNKPSDTPNTHAPEGYVFACRLSDLPERGKHTVYLEDRQVMIVVCNDQLFAVENSCPQTGGSIVHSKVIDHTLITTTTGAHYDLETGRFLRGGQSPLQSHWLAVFAVRVIEDRVYVRIPQQ